MIGNDVVDLTDADSVGANHHVRFDARVFAGAERALLESSERPERLRWMLWAAKESAYKLARRSRAQVVFSPSRFVVEELAADGLQAAVHTEVGTLRVRFEVAERYVHAVATRMTDRLAQTIAEVSDRGTSNVEASKGESEAVRTFAVRTVARTLGRSEAGIEIRRDGRIPQLFMDEKPAGPISLSHHGRFVAFALVIATV